MDKGTHDGAGRYSGVHSKRKDDARGEYEAFGKIREGRPNVSLKLRLLDDRQVIIYYTSLMEADCSGDYSIILYCTNCIAYISGQRLGRLIEMFEEKTADFVQVFDPNRFLKPDGDQPIVEDIRVARLFEGNVEQGGRA